jgi:glucose/mannose-6-phosphate isomerase
MLDVPEDLVRKHDKGDMLGLVLAYADMLQGALDEPLHVAPLPRAPDRVLVVGMGGSAISGDYLAAWLDHEGKVPLLVSRAYELPRWVDERTLVVGQSYSGTTEETLASFAEAKKRGAMLAAVSTGARLEELAKSYHAPFARLGGPAKVMPRAALPRGFGTGALLLEALGILPGARAALARTVRTLRECALEVAPDVDASKNEAKRVALALQGSVSATYATGLLAPAARRLANQLNENAKVLSWWGVMPEMNHNEIVGWAGDDELDRFTALFLRGAHDHPQARARFEFTGQTIQKRGGQVIQVEARGQSVPEQLLSVSLLGDAVSVYLAALRGADPTPVDVIGQLKAKVGETGFAAGIR